MTLIESGLISPVRPNDETQVELSNADIDLTDGTYAIQLTRCGVGEGTDGVPIMKRIDEGARSKFYVTYSNDAEAADMFFTVVRKT